MLICGINDGHNAAAALVKDGRLVSALQEERLNRLKNWQGFPLLSINAQLSAMGATIADVDAFVLSGTEFYPIAGGYHRDRDQQVRALKGNNSAWGRFKQFARGTFARSIVMKRRNAARRAAIIAQGIPESKLVQIDHHRCHAATAYYGKKPDRDALIVTLDGSGDGLCATVSVIGDDGRMKRLASIAEEHSIGSVWAVITSLTGMVPNEHEYKMMGMAPYASGSRVQRAADIFSRAFAWSESEGVWRRSAGMPHANYSYQYWRDALEFTRFDYVMGGLQLFTEQLVNRFVQHWLKRTGKSAVRLSGGVFMNVKANKVVMELPEVKDLYVFPSCGDETNAMGAAWAHIEDLGRAGTIEPIGPFYLGLEPSAADYDAAAELARQRGYQVDKPADVEERTAELLAAGEVVSRVNGREEFGARALGNRSILADPCRKDVVKLINQAIKSRDFWMPFAASVLDEAKERYLHNPKGVFAPYMILTFDSRNTEEVIAGCHPEDKTIRPQMVTKEWNGTYHKMICAFQKRTGRGAILNTSFNLHGEPIVSKPIEGIDVMDRSGLRHLVCGPYIISKRA